MWIFVLALHSYRQICAWCGTLVPKAPFKAASCYVEQLYNVIFGPSKRQVIVQQDLQFWFGVRFMHYCHKRTIQISGNSFTYHFTWDNFFLLLWCIIAFFLNFRMCLPWHFRKTQMQHPCVRCITRKNWKTTQLIFVITSHLESQTAETQTNCFFFLFLKASLHEMTVNRAMPTVWCTYRCLSVYQTWLIWPLCSP